MCLGFVFACSCSRLFCFVHVGVFLLLLVFLLLSLFGLLSFCSFCFLEWSRCCSCFVLFWFVLLVLVFVSSCLCLSVSYENHCFPCNSSVFWLIEKGESPFLISISGSCFLFLFWFLFQDVILYLFFRLFSCFVLNHDIILFALHILLFLLLLFWGYCLVFCYFSNFGYLSKTSLKNLEVPKKPPKMRTAEKTDILARAVSTGMFTNSVCFSFMCVFKFCMLAENTIQRVV